MRGSSRGDYLAASSLAMLGDAETRPTRRLVGYETRSRGSGESDRAWGRRWARVYFRRLAAGGSTLYTWLDCRYGRISVPAEALEDERILAAYLARSRARLRARRGARHVTR